MTIPSRVVGLDVARARHGARVDALVALLAVGDPAADAAPTPDALRRSVAVPPDLDLPRLDRAGRLLFRSGPIGGMVLGCRSLVSGYCAPAGNKPLALSGRLTGAAQRQRLAETGRFVAAVCRPGGAAPGGEGFEIALQVRRMHAAVRRLAARDPRWDPGWGVPINQHDQLATSLLFSQVFVDGVRAMGLRVTRAEAEDWLYLWRWVSLVLGVEPSLLPRTEDEARALVDTIASTQGPPDADARRLVHALLASDPRGRWLAEGLCRAHLGDAVADALGVPRHAGRHVARVSRWLAAPLEAARGRSRVLDDALVARGAAWWRAAAEAAEAAGVRFDYRPATDLPGRLG